MLLANKMRKLHTDSINRTRRTRSELVVKH